jgi:peptidyl-prolyl cis-trans isomerase D
MVAIIGLAILSFLLMDVFSSNSIFSGQSSNNVGEVDGDEISLMFFETRVTEAIENYKINTQQDRIDEATTAMLRDQVWNELIKEKVMGSSYGQLGLAVSTDELYDMVQGTNIHASVRQAFTNPETGEFDRTQVVQFIRGLDEQPEDIQRRWSNFERFIKNERESQKYNNLISKAFYAPAFFAKQQYAATNQKADGRFVLLDYAAIPDSSIAASEKELKAYYNAHLDDFESKEELRAIDYLVFDIIPSEGDDARALQRVSDLRADFMNASNDSLFVTLNSDEPYNDTYVEVGTMDPTQQSLYAGEIGTVTEVYRDGAAYKMTKLVERTVRPDSVKARHILIRVPEGQAPDAFAAKADSLFELAKKGDFARLARENSEDPGSAEKGGDLGFFGEGTMVKPFNDACFNGKKGDIVLVQSNFGFHIINIQDTKGRREVAKFATIVNQVEPSTETYREIYAKASRFLGQAKTAEAFETQIQEQGLVKRSAEGIRTGDRAISGMQDAREIVRWAYKAKVGIVSDVFEMEDKYIVAALISSVPKGAKSFETVRADVEAKVKRDLKAKQLIEKANKAIAMANGDMEVIAREAGGSVQTFTGATFQANFVPSAGREPAVTGTIFAIGQAQMSQPIQGERGVYVVAVDVLSEIDAQADLSSTQTTIKSQLAARVASEAFNAKKELVDQEDNRHLFY